MAATASPSGTTIAQPLKSSTASITAEATITPYQAGVRADSNRIPASRPNAVTAVKQADAAPIWNCMSPYPAAAAQKDSQ